MSVEDMSMKIEDPLGTSRDSDNPRRAQAFSKPRRSLSPGVL